MCVACVCAALRYRFVLTPIFVFRRFSANVVRWSWKKRRKATCPTLTKRNTSCLPISLSASLSMKSVNTWNLALRKQSFCLLVMVCCRQRVRVFIRLFINVFICYIVFIYCYNNNNNNNTLLFFSCYCCHYWKKFHFNFSFVFFVLLDSCSHVSNLWSF